MYLLWTVWFLQPKQDWCILLHFVSVPLHCLTAFVIDFWRIITKNWSKKNFHHWNRGAFFYQNLKFQVPPMNGLVFTAQTRLLHFVYISCQCLYTSWGHLSLTLTHNYEKLVQKISTFFVLIEIAAQKSFQISKDMYLLWTVWFLRQKHYRAFFDRKCDFVRQP